MLQLQLQQPKRTTTLADQLYQLEQRIAHTGDKINEKVYVLYGLSEEEIKLVERKQSDQALLILSSTQLPHRLLYPLRYLYFE